MKLRVRILTLFPRMVEGPLCESILGKAREKGLLETRIVDIRDFAAGKHRVTDDVRQQPQIYRIQAESGAVVKMVDTETGEIVWVGSTSEEGANIQAASASSRPCTR